MTDYCNVCNKFGCLDAAHQELHAKRVAESARFNVYQEPTPESVRDAMNDLAALAKARLPEGWHFVFLSITAGEGGHCAYISNCQRESVLEMMAEFVAKHGDA